MKKFIYQHKGKQKLFEATCLYDAKTQAIAFFKPNKKDMHTMIGYHVTEEELKQGYKTMSTLF